MIRGAQNTAFTGASQSPQPTLLARLKAETRDLHDKVESFLKLMAPDVSSGYYLWYLQRVYGFYCPVEAAMERVADLDDACPDFESRRKITLLEKDLNALSPSADPIGKLSVCVDIPHFRTTNDVLGCLYVLEGSTLGGAILSRHVCTVLGIRPDTGGAFLYSYGEQRGAMWMRLGQIISAVSLESGAEVVASARDTFGKFQSWMESSCGSAPVVSGIKRTEI